MSRRFRSSLLCLLVLAACNRAPRLDTLSGAPVIMGWHDLENGKSLLLFRIATYYYGEKPYEVSNVELGIRAGGQPIRTRWLREAEVAPFRNVPSSFQAYLKDARLYDQAPLQKKKGELFCTAVFEVDYPLTPLIAILDRERPPGEEALELRVTATDGRVSLLAPRTLHR